MLKSEKTGNTCIVMSVKDKAELCLLEPHLGRVVMISGNDRLVAEMLNDMLQTLA